MYSDTPNFKLFNSYLVDYVAFKQHITWSTMNCIVQFLFVPSFDLFITICLRQINKILIKMTKLSNAVSIKYWCKLYNWKFFMCLFLRKEFLVYSCIDLNLNHWINTVLQQIIYITYSYCIWFFCSTLFYDEKY